MHEAELGTVRDHSQINFNYLVTETLSCYACTSFYLGFRRSMYRLLLYDSIAYKGSFNPLNLFNFPGPSHTIIFPVNPV